MHYCTLLITKELPSEREIIEIMSPYYIGEDGYNHGTEERAGDLPIFTWEWYQIGGRYNGALKLKVDEEDEYYRWNYLTEDRNERLFYSYLLTEMKDFAGDTYRYMEENYFRTMGIRDGFLYVDGAKVDDLLNFDEVDCYICIDVEGNVIIRDSWDEDKKFDEELAEIKKNSKGCFVTVLDIHE